MKKRFHIEEPILIVTLSFMLIIVFFNVVSRKVLHLSFSFIEELVCVLFVLLTTIGSAAASRDETHFNLDLITGSMEPKLRNIFMIINNCLTLTAAAILVVTGFNMVSLQRMMRSVSDSLHVPQWIYSLTLPVGSVLICIRCLMVIIRRVRHIKEGEQK